MDKSPSPVYIVRGLNADFDCIVFGVYSSDSIAQEIALHCSEEGFDAVDVVQFEVDDPPTYKL